jgi:hypothetical protein
MQLLAFQVTQSVVTRLVKASNARVDLLESQAWKALSAMEVTLTHAVSRLARVLVAQVVSPASQAWKVLLAKDIAATHAVTQPVRVLVAQVVSLASQAWTVLLAMEVTKTLVVTQPARISVARVATLASQTWQALLATEATKTRAARQLVQATPVELGRHSNLVTAAFMVAHTVSVAHLHVKDINAQKAMCQLQTTWLAMAGTTTLAVQALVSAMTVELATP